MGGNVAVGVSLGGSPTVGVNSGVNVAVDGIVAVGGNVVVGVTLGGSVLVRVSLGGSIDVGVSLGVSDVVGGSAAAGGNVAVGEVVMGGIVGISVEVTVGGIFSFSAMAVGGGNVAVSLGLGSPVVVNVIDVVCPFCFCCVLGGVVDPDLLLGRLRSLTKLTASSTLTPFLAHSQFIFFCFNLFSDHLKISQRRELYKLYHNEDFNNSYTNCLVR